MKAEISRNLVCGLSNEDIKILKEFKKLIVNLPKIEREDEAFIINFINSIETIKKSEEDTFKVKKPLPRLSCKEAFNDPYTPLEILNYYYQQDFIINIIINYCILMNHNFELAAKMLNFNYRLLKGTDAPKEIEIVCEEIKKAYHEFADEYKDTEFSKIIPKMQAALSPSKKLATKVQLPSINDCKDIKFNKVREGNDPLRIYIIKYLELDSDKDKPLKIDLSGIEESSTDESIFEESNVLKPELNDRDSLELKRNVDLNKLKHILFDFVVAERDRLGDHYYGNQKGKYDRFCQLAEVDIENYNLSEILEFKEKVLTTTQIRRSSVGFLWSGCMFMSWIAEQLSRFCPFFRTTSKKNFDKEIAPIFNEILTNSRG